MEEQQLRLDEMCAQIALSVKKDAENGRSTKHHQQDAARRVQEEAEVAAAAASDKVSPHPYFWLRKCKSLSSASGCVGVVEKARV